MSIIMHNMTDGPVKDSSLVDERDFLQNGKLNLPEFAFSLSEENSYPTYSMALTRYAVPIVDFLSQMDETGIQRQGSIFAAFNSQFGDDEGNQIRRLESQIAWAVNDLGLAADLRIALDGHPPASPKLDASRFLAPGELLKHFDTLQLPPALRRRIEPRRDEVLAQLQNAIIKPKLSVKSQIKAGYLRGKVQPKIPDYTIAIYNSPATDSLGAKTAKVHHVVALG